MGFFRSLFSSIGFDSMFTTYGAGESFVSPPEMGAPKEMYGSSESHSMWGDAPKWESPKWESRVDDGPSGGIGM